jgi:hypothetical protein
VREVTTVWVLVLVTFPLHHGFEPVVTGMGVFKTHEACSDGERARPEIIAGGSSYMCMPVSVGGGER